MVAQGSQGSSGRFNGSMARNCCSYFSQAPICKLMHGNPPSFTPLPCTGAPPTPKGPSECYRPSTIFLSTLITEMENVQRGKPAFPSHPPPATHLALAFGGSPTTTAQLQHSSGASVEQSCHCRFCHFCGLCDLIPSFAPFCHSLDLTGLDRTGGAVAAPAPGPHAPPTCGQRHFAPPQTTASPQHQARDPLVWQGLSLFILWHGLVHGVCPVYYLFFFYDLGEHPLLR